jgi:ribosomal protein S6--L-glutamate ligase
MDISADAPQVLYQGAELSGYDAVIPRIGASHTFYGTAVVRQFEMSGVYSAIDSQAIMRSRDKLRCLQILTRSGVDLPVTGFAHSIKDIDRLIDLVGGPPLVVKLIEGTQGNGVILAETRSAACAVIEAFRQLDANILVQEFIEEAGGADIRCLVVGRKVIASMKRQAPPGEFRSNLHQGAVGFQVAITPEERLTAIKAARAVGLRIAGVDLLRSRRGPLVMEVNSSPGLEGIEAVTRIDIASRIITYVEQQVLHQQSKRSNKISITEEKETPRGFIG